MTKGSLLPRLTMRVLVAATAWCAAVYAQEQPPLVFDTKDTGVPSAEVPAITPWRTVVLDPDYGGRWVVAGDLDNDGEVELVSAENHNVEDVHYTSAAAAQELDGTVLWRWGNPDIGRKKWHHDVACQIHDWDGDGKAEVILLDKKHLVELDGLTGQERRRFPIPEEATDCVVFCDLTGAGRPTDVLVKNRYHQIWAYNREGKLLWTVENPGGYRTAHQPFPLDIDGDGRDEIMAGYALLNPDGSVRWVYQSKAVDQSSGHLDCVRIVREGKTPEDFRLVLTCCGANNIALIDGNGAVQWEVSGHHFESINVGRVVPGHPSPQILVDIDHLPMGEAFVWLLDAEGKRLGRLGIDYGRHHKLLDWTGDGLDEIFIAHNCGVYNGQGQRIATLAVGRPDEPAALGERSMLKGDMTGDGVPDAVIVTVDTAYIYENKDGKKPDGTVPLGTRLNFSLY